MKATHIRLIANRPVSKPDHPERPLYAPLRAPDERVRIGAAECSETHGRMSAQRVDRELGAVWLLWRAIVYTMSPVAGWQLADWFWPIVIDAVMRMVA